MGAVIPSFYSTISHNGADFIHISVRHLNMGFNPKQAVELPHYLEIVNNKYSKSFIVNKTLITL